MKPLTRSLGSGSSYSTQTRISCSICDNGRRAVITQANQTAFMDGPRVPEEGGKGVIKATVGAVKQMKSHRR